MPLTNLISHSFFDFPIRLAEVFSRQIYWRSTHLQKLRKKTKVVEPKYLDLKKLEKFYSENEVSGSEVYNKDELIQEAKKYLENKL